MKSTIVKFILISIAVPLFAGKFDQGILREQISDSITLFYTDKYVEKKKCQKVEKVQASLVLYEKVMQMNAYTRFPTGIFKTEVRIDNRFVDPYETDSIIVCGKVGKPHTRSQWAFSYESGLITVSTMLPNSLEYNPFYITNNGKREQLPPYLSLTDTNDVLVEFSRKMARFPRLYCDYSILGSNGIGGQRSPKNSHRVAIITTMNKLTAEQRLDSITGERASKLSHKLVVSSFDKKQDFTDISELLSLEPNSVIGNCKMAEFAIKAGDMTTAMEYYKKASENQIGEDFLVAELSGKLYEAEGNKEEAINAYNHAIDIIGERDSQFYKSRIKDLQNRIGLMSRNK